MEANILMVIAEIAVAQPERSGKVCAPNRGLIACG
jgi:hypothetical protein